KPLFAVCETHEMLEFLHAHAVPSLYLCPEFAPRYPAHELEHAFRHADRVVFASSSVFHAVAQTTGFYPTNVAVAPPGIVAADPSTSRQGARGRAVEVGEEPEYAASLFELASRDFGVPTRIPVQANDGVACTRRIIVPCSDWALSGVNSA